MTKFKGLEAINQSYDISSFECQGCSNICNVNKVAFDNGKDRFFYGHRCEKYDVDKDSKVEKNTMDLFAEREELLLNSYSKEVPEGTGIARVGIPFSMITYQDYPYWKAFFTEIGCEVILSKSTNRWHINKGLEKVVDETCFPVKVLHGHVFQLIEKKPDYIFLPHLLELKNEYTKIKECFLCPYVQSMPDVIRTAVDLESLGIKVLRPAIKFSLGEKYLIKQLHENIGKALGVSKNKIKAGVVEANKALNNFFDRIQERGREVLENLTDDDIAIVLVSRPYNGCDRGINLNIPQKLIQLGVKAIPMDYLPLHTEDVADELLEMTWWFGQRILSAARIIRDNPRLQAIYLTNFACGPDSFLLQYFRYMLGSKPYLQLEIDEHSADAGLVTRVEAFVDSIRQTTPKEAVYPRIPEKDPASRFEGRTLYLPPMGDQMYALKAALIKNGFDSEVLPMSDDESLEWGRKYTNNKECYPYILTTGDMIRKIKSDDFDPDKTAFFMPTSSGMCRLNHYSHWQRIILKELGHSDIPILSPDADDDIMEEMGELGEDFPTDAWRGIAAIDTIYKALRETKPYEMNKGETERVYNESRDKICQTVVEGGKMVNIMKLIRKDFDAIKVDKSVRKPVIGIVGELYNRNNPYSNNFLVEQIEDLGGEVWNVTISEILLYLNFIYLDQLKSRKEYKKYISMFIEDRFQRRYEHNISKTFKGYLRNFPEPTVDELFKTAKPYFDPIAETETPLSIGKSILFTKMGVSGMINAIPFTCMPGTVAATLYKRLKDDFPDAAFLTFKFDGTGSVNIKTRLEAFMYQANQYSKMKVAN